MDYLVILLLIFATGFLCLICFVAGAKVGQKVVKGEPIELPTINPLELHREREAKKEAAREQERLETIMQNIEAYDGTASGQRDVPRG